MNTIQTQQWTKWLGAGAILLIGSAGCADRNKNGQPDSVATESEVSRTVDNAGDAATSAANKAGQAASNAADSFGNAAKNLDDAAVMTPKIKTAFGNSPVLKGSNIDVSTTDKNVTLSGTVKTRLKASSLKQRPRRMHPGYKVVNNLKVSGGASPVQKKS
jgi:osmotically-inducible protein OsmY